MDHGRSIVGRINGLESAVNGLESSVDRITDNLTELLELRRRLNGLSPEQRDAVECFITTCEASR